MTQLSAVLVLTATVLIATGLLTHLVRIARPVDALAPGIRHRTAATHPARAVASGGVGIAVRPPGNLTPPAAARARPYLGDLLSILPWGTLTLALVARAVATGHGPFANQYEFAIAFAWGCLTAHAVLARRSEGRVLALVVLPVVLALLLYARTIGDTVRPLRPALQHRWLLSVHVATAVLAYGAAAVAFGAAVLYLLAGRVSARWLPSRGRTDDLGYRATVFAFPLMTLAIVLGAVWADIAWGRYWSWDPKENAALVTWLIYGGYLHARIARGWRGDRAAWLLVLGFAAVVFTYLGNLFLGGLHTYA